MLSGRLSTEAIMAKCRPDTRNLVCRNGNADTGSANDNTKLTLSAGNCLCYLLSVNRIITGLFALAAVILVLDTALLQMLDHFLLQSISTMVTS